MKWSNFREGDIFGDWVVIRKSTSKQGTRYYECRCKCGTVSNVRGATLGKGSNKCKTCAVVINTERITNLAKERSNGNPSRVSGTFECYRSNAWGNIQRRTINSGKRCTDKSYERKKRLLLMTKDEFYFWLESQRAIIEEMYANGKTPSIDRIDNNGNYSIDNIQCIELIQNIRKDKNASRF